MSDLMLLLGAQWEEIMLLFSLGAVGAALSQILAGAQDAPDLMVSPAPLAGANTPGA